MPKARSPRRPDGSMSATELLKQDHRNVEALFEQFEDASEAPEERLPILHEITFQLTLHARVEEELLYPLAREVLGDDAADLIDEASVEHASLKHLLIELSNCDGRERLFAAKVKVLAEYVNHHVEEEEGELFPALERSGVDLEALGEQLAMRKAALQQAYQPDAGVDGEDGRNGNDDNEETR